MFRLKSRIIITPQNEGSRYSQITYPFVTELSITSSFDDLTDTAEITLPKTLSQTEGKDFIFEEINAGDRIDIELNYDEFKTSRFAGYVSEVTPSVPIKISCEDEMFVFKTFSLKGINYANATLKQVLDYVFSQAKSKSPLWRNQNYILASQDIDLGKFEIGEGALPLKVFEELKKTYGLYTYCKDRVFYVGFQFSEAENDPIVIDAQNQVIEDNTEYNTDKFRQVLVKAKSINKNGSTLEATAGVEGGDTISKVFYNVTSLASLQAKADAELKAQTLEGLKGSFTTFLHPKIEHSQKVAYTDRKNPEKSGVYFVRSVTTSSGLGGGRQNVKLGGI